MKIQNCNALATLLTIPLMLTACVENSHEEPQQSVEPSNILTPSTEQPQNTESVEKVKGYNYSGKSISTRTIQVTPLSEDEPKKPLSSLDLVQLKVTPHKPEYKVGEHIQFTVEGNKSYYLYAYSIDTESGEVVQLIPNDDTADNHLNPNQKYDVPKTVNFHSDSVGKERLIFMGVKSPITDEQMTGVVGKFATAKVSDLKETWSNIDEDYAKPFSPDYNTRSIVISKLSDGSVKPVPNFIDLPIN